MTKTASKLVDIIGGIVMVALSGLLGALCGGVWIKHGMERASNGWDGIADAIGGLMLGGFVGLVLGLLLLVILLARGGGGILAAAGSVALAAALVFSYLWLTRPVGAPDGDPAAPIRPPPEPIYQPRFEIVVSHPYVDRLLREMSPSDGPLPFGPGFGHQLSAGWPILSTG